jgi:hypothetical protein
MYAEPIAEVRDAIVREKQITAWRRSHKVALIDSVNPEWNDLGEVWFGLKGAMNLDSSTQSDSSENDEIPPSSG